MRKSLRARTALGIATVASIALVATGCATDDGSNSGEGGDITLTIATFNDFGYTDELLAEYEAANPERHDRAEPRGDLQRRACQPLHRSWPPAAVSPTSRPSRSTGCPS